MSKLTFNAWTEKDEGKLCGQFSYNVKIEAKFDKFLDELEDDSPNSMLSTSEKRNELMEYCSSITREHPQFIDAYAHAAAALLANDETEAAKVWALRGLEQAYAVLPKGYKGAIEWGYLANRPFLRLHHILILTLSALDDIHMAMDEAEKHLLWNKNDNLGVRYILADIYTYMSDGKKAYALMKKADNNELDPSYCYNLGLLLFKEGKFHESLTKIRLGIVKNPYIAEALLGVRNSMNRPMWHSTSEAGQEYATAHAIGWAGEAWSMSQEAFQFLNWAYNGSEGLELRAKDMKLHEEIDCCDPSQHYAQRLVAINNLTSFINQIDLKSTKTIKLTKETRSGEKFAWVFK